MSASGTNAGPQMLAPFIDSLIDEAAAAHAIHQLPTENCFSSLTSRIFLAVAAALFDDLLVLNRIHISAIRQQRTWRDKYTVISHSRYF